VFLGEEFQVFKLKKVELLGFKSFADRTQLLFGEGTVAIVGPNGCGKSNIADAISWVLGEQSPRLLRGERMADVIFNGTRTRPATSMAEVSLTLLDPEGNSWPAPSSTAQPEPADEAGPVYTAQDGARYRILRDGAEPLSRAVLAQRGSEIVITRRIYRSGESEYLLNGETCRLRDIQELFMGTGLGPESYAIIEQGRIGQILSSKPSDRRALIEEAAGISKFRSRKRLAEAKLESARQNLARLTDILEEISKQVNSLKRQASKARRYRELSEELKARQRVALGSRLLSLAGERARLQEDWAACQERCAAATATVEALEQEQKAACQRFEQAEAELNGCRQSLGRFELEAERLRSRTDQLRQQAANLEARAAEALQTRRRLEGEAQSAEQQRAEGAARSQQLDAQRASAQETVRQLTGWQTEMMEQISAQEARLEGLRQALLGVVSQGAAWRNQLVQADEAALALERERARVEAERGGVQAELERARAELDSLRLARDREAAFLATLSESMARASVAIEEARQRAATAQEEMERLRQEYAQAHARKQALEESLGRHAYASDSVRRLLSASLGGNGHSFRALGVLADFVEVAAGHEEVVEEFLKRELDCVVVEQHEQARQGIALLEREGTGRSTFFVTRFQPAGGSNGHGGETRCANPEVRHAPGVVASLEELVRFHPELGLNGDVVLPALANAYLVEDASAAERLAAQYPASHFLTARGEHYHHRLVSGGKAAGVGPLALRREFRELEHRTSALQSALKRAEEAFAQLSARATQIEGELNGLTAQRLEAEKRLVLVDEKIRQAEEAVGRAHERLQVLAQEAARIEEERTSLAARRAELESQLAQVSRQQAEHQQEIDAATQATRARRAELDRVTQDLAQAQAQASALEERARALEAERTRLAEQAEGIRLQLAALAQQETSWAEERQRLKLEEESARTALAQLEAAQAEGRDRLRGLEAEVQAARARRDELGLQLEAARHHLEQCRQARSQTEVTLARFDSDLAHCIQQCSDELGMEAEALKAELAGGQPLEGEALQAAEAEVRELKRRIENIGPVNMMALEELQEAEERYSFLETQRQDLLASISDTTQTIREIDQVSRRQFSQAFQAINGFFAESFRTLFGGGTGEMRLSDEADPESGIDLVVQPPGKRLQNVLLLSGGEKALTALALLIAVFRFTPSPFCILDEVDAPLDDSNVERFTRMIQRMSDHTQFILMTHNKRTMEICRVLYGVTMEEPGVSKVVSVRLEAGEPEPAEPVLA
jgi:chromosome segregation protein